jgi:hypothetical protein
MSDEQQLNSLDRFRKQSGRLVLEEHGHCEIPAGCGGVVLRWRNPHIALPFVIHLYTRAAGRCFLDGEEVRLGRRDIAIGRHILALAIEDVELSTGLLLFAASHDPKDYGRRKSSGAGEGPLNVLSAADGTWKCTLAEPPPEWTSLAFDDRDWLAMSKAPTPKLDRGEEGAYAIDCCARLDAACLDLPRGDHPTRGRVWVRKVFEVPAPKERKT